METHYRFIVLLLLALAVTGCAGDVGGVAASIDNRSVIANNQVFSNASIRACDGKATVTLGGKTVQITATEITWALGGSLKLPTGWKRLHLNESGKAITVIVDGIPLTDIYPAA